MGFVSHSSLSLSLRSGQATLEAFSFCKDLKPSECECIIILYSPLNTVTTMVVLQTPKNITSKPSRWFVGSRRARLLLYCQDIYFISRPAIHIPNAEISREPCYGRNPKLWVWYAPRVSGEKRMNPFGDSHANSKQALRVSIIAGCKKTKC